MFFDTLLQCDVALVVERESNPTIILNSGSNAGKAQLSNGLVNMIILGENIRFGVNHMMAAGIFDLEVANSFNFIENLYPSTFGRLIR